MPRTYALIPAAGTSSRMGSSGSKVRAHIDGVSVLERTVMRIAADAHVVLTVVMTQEAELDDVRLLLKKYENLKVIAGGASRAESVRKGLMFLAAQQPAPSRDDLVLIHDAARCAVSATLITRVIEAATQHGAAIPGIPQSDTLKRVENGVITGTVPREGLFAVQTPQVFRFALFQDALTRPLQDVSDDAALIELQVPVRIVEGEPSNIKITWPDDLRRVADVLASTAVS